MDRVWKQFISCFIVMLIFMLIINISVDNEMFKACLRLILISNMVSYFFGSIKISTLIPITLGTSSYMYLILDYIQNFQDTDLIIIILLMFISNIIVYLHTLHMSLEKK